MTGGNQRRSITLVLAGWVVVAALLSSCGSPEPGLRLVFFSDVHARAEWDTPEALAMAADAINAKKADVVIGGGDLITDGFQAPAASVAHRWDVYMTMHDALKGNVHAVIGNHDLVAAMPEDGTPPSQDPRQVFRDRIGVERTYYSFDVNGYHVILLDSIEITDFETKYRGFINDEQLAWLAHDLASVPQERPIILATHIPFLTTFHQATEGATTAAPESRVVVNNREVLAIFEDHNLVLVLQGHLHVSEVIRWRNTTFITGGAISGRWWRGAWHGTPEGFTQVTLRGSDIEWEYVTYGWEARRPNNR